MLRLRLDGPKISVLRSKTTSFILRKTKLFGTAHARKSGRVYILYYLYILI